jgi:hypothetical protein
MHTLTLTHQRCCAPATLANKHSAAHLLRRRAAPACRHGGMALRGAAIMRGRRRCRRTFTCSLQVLAVPPRAAAQML